ncbi:hypothetical protein [Salinispora arenicola]|uniref:hypothetical protein n=1 Tax=Salinispora arenicola TaxID=168697 RepID=UPI00207AE609|nr:hypothetical protein [Salinispora arenicola]MCN0153284.1 hypothetical protein [Salinispora arenicola]
MPQLDELVNQWLQHLETSEPALAPHLDEIADHICADAQARIDTGSDVSVAFAAAVEAFGAPRDVAKDYLVSARRSERRAAAGYGAVVIGVSLIVTTTAVLIDKAFYPLDSRWLALGLVVPPVAALCIFMWRLSNNRAASRLGEPR